KSSRRAAAALVLTTAWGCSGPQRTTTGAPATEAPRSAPWVRAVTTPGVDAAFAVASGPEGSVCVAGVSVNADEAVLFVRRFGRDGALEWERSLSGGLRS